MRRREYTLSLRRPFLKPANLEQSAVFLRKASLFVTINLPTATLNDMATSSLQLGKREPDSAEILHIGATAPVSTKGPKRPGYNLTFNLDGVTRTRHIRKQNLEKVRLMTARHKKLKQMIHKLSDLNWLILSRQSE
jgi:hypothetical protein